MFLLKCDYMQMQADRRLSRIRNALGRRHSSAHHRRLLHRLRKAERFDDKAFAALEEHLDKGPFGRGKYRLLTAAEMMTDAERAEFVREIMARDSLKDYA